MKSPTRKRKTSLFELERRLVATSNPGTPVRAFVIGPRGIAARDPTRELDQLKGSKRRKGLAALAEPRTDGRERKACATSRAYDLGAPIAVVWPRGHAFALAFDGRSRAAWPSIFTPDDDDVAATPITAFTVEAFAAPVDDAAAETVVEVAALEHVAAEPLPSGAPPAQRYDAEATPAALDLGTAFADDRDEESEQFARQIQALLSGATSPAQASPQAPAAPPAPAPVASQGGRAVSRGHAIFDKMGHDMAYATTYHLPAMELGRRFDDIERQIARDAKRAEAPPRIEPNHDDSAALELSDDEILESLKLAATPAKPIDATPAPNLELAPQLQPAVDVAVNGSVSP